MGMGVAGLITAMERSIARANLYMQTMAPQKALTAEP